MTDKQQHTIRVALNFLSEQLDVGGKTPEQVQHLRQLGLMWLGNCPLSKEDVENAMKVCPLSVADARHPPKV